MQAPRSKKARARTHSLTRRRTPSRAVRTLPRMRASNAEPSSRSGKSRSAARPAPASLRRARRKQHARRRQVLRRPVRRRKVRRQQVRRQQAQLPARREHAEWAHDTARLVKDDCPGSKRLRGWFQHWLVHKSFKLPTPTTKAPSWRVLRDCTHGCSRSVGCKFNDLFSPAPPPRLLRTGSLLIPTPCRSSKPRCALSCSSAS